MRWLGAAVLFATLSVCTAPTPAWAKPTRNDRQAALKLGGEALDLYAAGDYAAALEKFQKADGIVPAPTLKLHVARCLDKLDRMKEAAEVYRDVIATELKADSPAVHREARKKAVPELAGLLEQMPTASVVVKGPGAAEAQLTMDGQSLDVSLVGEKMSLDPGHYRFDAVAGERKITREIDLARGQNERVVLHLPGNDEPDEPIVVPDEEESTMAWQIGGWAAVGLGGAGIVVGAVLGGLVLSEESDLEARCPNRQCPPSAHDDANSFDAKRIGSTIAFIAGGVFAAAGVTILLLAPSGSDAEASLMVGPGFVGLEGSF